MATSYTHVHRSTATVEGGWRMIEYDVEDSDVDGRYSTVDFQWTAPGNGWVLVQNCFRIPAETYSAGFNHLFRSYINGADVVNSERYEPASGKQRAVGWTQPEVRSRWLPITSGDELETEAWVASGGGNDNSWAGGASNNGRFLFVDPETSPVIHQYSMDVTQPGITHSSSVWTPWDAWDITVRGDGSWLGVDNETFTMPNDGWLVATVQTYDLSGFAQQRLHVRGRISIDGVTDVDTLGGGLTAENSGWNSTINFPITPVLEGEEVKFDFQFSAFSSETYNRYGFAEASKWGTLITLRLFT